MTCSMRQDDVGTELRITIVDCNGLPVDVSGANNKEFIFQKPDSSFLTKTASFYTDGTDGKLSYIIEDGVLDQVGAWKIQAHVTTIGGAWKSNIKTFKVNSNLPLS